MGIICESDRFWGGTESIWVMDGESGESTDTDHVVGARKGKSKIEKVGWGWRTELGSWFHRQGETYRKERSVIRNEDYIGGRARVTRDEEQVLRRGWTEMRLRAYGGWVVVHEDFVSYWEEFVFDVFG